jgi:hypothetical protein
MSLCEVGYSVRAYQNRLFRVSGIQVRIVFSPTVVGRVVAESDITSRRITGERLLSHSRNVGPG